MGQKPSAALRRPPESGIVTRTWRAAFKQGSQSASAEAVVKTDCDPRIEAENRQSAERLARQKAEEKYVSEFHEPIDWPVAQVLVSHDTYGVTVYINVEI